VTVTAAVTAADPHWLLKRRCPPWKRKRRKSSLWSRCCGCPAGCCLLSHQKANARKRGILLRLETLMLEAGVGQEKSERDELLLLVLCRDLSHVTTDQTRRQVPLLLGSKDSRSPQRPNPGGGHWRRSSPPHSDTMSRRSSRDHSCHDHSQDSSQTGSRTRSKQSLLDSCHDSLIPQSLQRHERERCQGNEKELEGQEEYLLKDD
jgi:hypothetical protein